MQVAGGIQLSPNLAKYLHTLLPRQPPREDGTSSSEGGPGEVLGLMGPLVKRNGPLRPARTSCIAGGGSSGGSFLPILFFRSPCTASCPCSDIHPLWPLPACILAVGQAVVDVSDSRNPSASATCHLCPRGNSREKGPFWALLFTAEPCGVGFHPPNNCPSLAALMAVFAPCFIFLALGVSLFHPPYRQKCALGFRIMAI